MTAGDSASGRSSESTGLGGVGEFRATVSASQRGRERGVEALRVGVEEASRWPRPGTARVKWHGIFFGRLAVALGNGNLEGKTDLGVREDRIDIVVGHLGGCCADGSGVECFLASSLLLAASGSCQRAVTARTSRSP